MRHASLVALALLAGCGGLQVGNAVPPGTAVSRSAEASSQYRVLDAFTKLDAGVHPSGGLIDADGTLYGTTIGGGYSRCQPSPFCGTVYSMTTAGALQVLYRFKGGADGDRPMAKLLNINGTFYGTTSRGGTGCKELGCGTVFSIGKSGNETVLYRFGGVSDGATPVADLTVVEGVLYGTTEFGGGSQGCSGSIGGCGTVFSVTLAGKERVLYRFTAGADGANPVAGLISIGRTLYGTASHAGDGYGTVYRITTKGAFKIVHRFADSPDGADPEANLSDVGGALYGTTAGGGGFSEGTVFHIDKADVESVLYSFRASSSHGEGDNVDLPITYDRGKLYVASQRGGEGKCFDECGILYSINLHGDAQVLHEFAGGSDGCLPSSGLLLVNGTLYGATTLGGQGGKRCSQIGPGGTIYTLTP
jgi:uncharacterized repeat protein (TIGR03803 family)